jgi:hypothetical protein
MFMFISITSRDSSPEWVKPTAEGGLIMFVFDVLNFYFYLLYVVVLLLCCLDSQFI